MFFLKRPTYFDIVILSVFTVLITLHPFFIHGKINIFEVGLYLPGIQSILNGEIPYRDFFYLRGPFELYVPAFMMRIFGENIAVLSSYFCANSRTLPFVIPPKGNNIWGSVSFFIL